MDPRPSRMRRVDPFAPDAPRVWTIPAGEPFLVRLAETLAHVSGLKDNPAALSDDLIYVPNRRSARALALELYRAAGETPILPPDIRALGDLETDEPPSGAEEALTDLGPPLSNASRLGALARLVLKFYEARGETLPVRSALSAARELIRLLDQAALAGGVDWQHLPDLVQDTDLATHWQQSVEFLSILTEHWPAWLEENGSTEPYQRRLHVAEAIAATLTARAPKGRFLIAGSTGATPASRQLMQVATTLDLGRVVLPGLDLDARADSWPLLAQEPDHPQHALAGTLATLDLQADDIAIWPGADNETLQARRRLVHESLAPARQTADWLTRLKSLSGDRPPSEFAKDALAGLSIIEANDDADEAELCALMMRQALEVDDRTVALVTPDPSLARRVSAALKRWDLNVSPSAGVPLGRTPAGSLVLLVLKWLEDTGDPVRLLSLLKHGLVAFDEAGVAALDKYYLRGPRRWAGIDDLGARFEALTEQKNQSRHTAVPAEMTNTVQPLLKRLVEDSSEVTAAQIDTIVRLIDRLTGSETVAWTGADGAAAARTIDAAMEVAAHLPASERPPIAEIFESLSAVTTVPDIAPGHARLAIWGPLEARLQTADQLILAGLNEDVWPDRPAADGFLPRRFRAPLGLAPPEARLGLAAHDFAGLATAPDVTLLYAARREDAPAIASRWILRLQTLIQGALGEEAGDVLAPAPDRDPRPWADLLHEVAQTSVPQEVMPRPSPLASARPTRLSITRINTLQRDPYSIYAEAILGLNKLSPINEPLGPSARGTAIHAAIEKFGNQLKSEQTLPYLRELVHQELVRAGQPEHLVISEKASLSVATERLFEWWQTRSSQVAERWSEVRGNLTVDIAGEPFILTGIADQIDALSDGTLSIIDFKTGGSPTKKTISAGFEQQLPLLGWMAEAGTFDGLSEGPVSELGYISVRYNFTEAWIASSADEAKSLSASAREILVRLITAYRDPSVPYLSIPRIQLKSSYEGDFDRLARRAEWAGEMDDG
ncbi:MAG: double-strand break repair protein AddB [Pseudomonadota bacterium]